MGRKARKVKDKTREALESVWNLGGLTRRQLCARVWNDIYEGDLFTRSAALSYYFLLALFPLLLFLTAALGYFADAGTELRQNLLNYLASVARTACADISSPIRAATPSARNASPNTLAARSS